MNILVLLRPVRDPGGFTVNRKAQKIFSNREGFILNPSDRNALEAALTLAAPDDHVTAVALGGEPALDALRSARASGAGRAIHLASLAAPDPLAIATVLRQVINHLGSINLVLLGADVLDSDSAQVGSRLAAALDWPFVDRAQQATTLPDGGLGLVVSRDSGFRLIGVDLPAVTAVARDSNKPRFAPAKEIITVFSDPDAIETLTLSDIGLDAADLAPTTTIRGELFPPERTLGQIAQGEDAVSQFVAALTLSH